jgi:hypothetical protein
MNSQLVVALKAHKFPFKFDGYKCIVDQNNVDYLITNQIPFTFNGSEFVLDSNCSELNGMEKFISTVKKTLENNRRFTVTQDKNKLLVTTTILDMPKYTHCYGRISNTCLRMKLAMIEFYNDRMVINYPKFQEVCIKFKMPLELTCDDFVAYQNTFIVMLMTGFSFKLTTNYWDQFVFNSSALVSVIEDVMHVYTSESKNINFYKNGTSFRIIKNIEDYPQIFSSFFPQ